MPSWPFALAALPAAFGVADATGVRPLGGLVLAVLAALAVLRPGVERLRAGLWLVLLAACFAASHALADLLGTWAAVAVVTAVSGLAGVVLLDDARPSRQAPPGR